MMTVTHVPHNKLNLRIGGELRTYDRGITNEELMQAVPSVFQVQSHESRSSRFAPISTIKVIEELRKEGFVPCYAMQSKARDESKIDFTKHRIHLRPVDYDYRKDWNEIILVNANDGSSSYQLSAGRFRLVCSNGLVLGDRDRSQVIYHKGTHVERDVIEGAFTVVKEFDETDRLRLEMEKIMLTEKERKQLAFLSMVMCTGSTSSDDFKFEPAKLLTPRRREDTIKPDLWSTFNIIQENAIKGGVKYYNGETDRNATSREIKSISKNLDINRALWKTATLMVEDKQAVVTA